MQPTSTLFVAKNAPTSPGFLPSGPQQPKTTCFARIFFQVKEHFHHHNVDKDKESLRNEVTKVKKQIVSGEHIAVHQRSELQKLTRIIQEADEERQRQVRFLSKTHVLYAQGHTLTDAREGGVTFA